MTIPTEPIGSIPRTPQLLEATQAHAGGHTSAEELARTGDEAVRQTIEELEATGSPVITDGEQTKPSFATYPIAGLGSLSPDGMVIPFEDGHTRQLPKLTAGPFAYGHYADEYLRTALRFASVPTPPTARRWTTPSCYPACSSSTSAASTCSWPASPTDPKHSGS